MPQLNMNLPLKMNRRECLGGLGLGSIALASLLAEQNALADPAGSAANSPLAPRPPHFEARAKNVIFLFMVGGASHLETFDYKPALKKFAGKSAQELFSEEELNGFNPEKDFSKSAILPPVFEFKQRGQCGHWVSEIYPHLCQVVDEIAMIKSMHTASPIHSVGQLLMNTGYNRPGFPSLGSWLSYGLGSENRNMPSFVVMRDGPSTNSSGGAAMYHSGFLPSTHQATLVETKKNQPPIQHLSRIPQLTADAQRRQLELMTKLNRLHRKKHATQPELDARIDAFETAFRMQSAAPELFDLSREPASVRKLYGDTEFGDQCLTARRLVENGVRFVEIFDGAVGRRWDAHGNRGGLIGNHRSNAARTDQAIAGLIKDLKSRGLLDDTLVVWATEFGRTPFEEERNTKQKIGRGHHHYGFTMWMAGGGVKGGFSYGATDELGMHAVENPVSHHDLHATILHLLGLDHKQLTYLHNGRDFRLTDVHGRVVHDLFA
ncbi:MAG: DUF1501 domain-containing protein [Planctomycetota bacterium]|nr:DUF1501 domain-containing protein [Planctomycetota bacterium]